MPRAEVGSTKHLSNKLKSKGLQRLRWYCQACEKQCRDENGFKCHTQSESHIRQMALVGEDPKRYIAQYSADFLRDFLALLRTAHGEKPVHVNRFYQEYIANKEHIHMNATKWPSLTELAKYLGREGICRVSEEEKGLFIAWIDNSPEALRRQDAVRKKERQDKGDEEREQRLIAEQVERARLEALAKSAEDREAEDKARELQRVEGEKVKLSFAPVAVTAAAAKKQDEQPKKVSLSLGGGAEKPKNALNALKNPLAAKKAQVMEQPKKMSEAERIMKEEMARKRGFAGAAAGPEKKRIRL